MLLTFAHFLEQVRKDRDLTQQEMLELLVEAEPTLSKLDLTTFSRWERGVTTPKLSKQLLIARIMGADIAPLIDPRAQAVTRDKNHLEQLHLRIRNPYNTDSTNFRTQQYKSPIDEDGLCKQLLSFHVGYLGMDMQRDDLNSENLTLQAFFDDSGRLVGHLLYGFIDMETSPSPHVRNKLSDCQFISLERARECNLMMYVVSSFSLLTSSRMTLILMILDILRQNVNIKFLCVNSHNHEGYSLLEANADCEVIEKGDLLPFGGVKVYGKHYRFVRLKVGVERILASKVIADVAPFTDDYIESLLEAHQIE